MQNDWKNIRKLELLDNFPEAFLKKELLKPCCLFLSMMPGVPEQLKEYIYLPTPHLSPLLMLTSVQILITTLPQIVPCQI